MNPETPPKAKQVPAPSWPRPATEWPTIALFFAVAGLFAASTAVGLSLPRAWWPLFVVINALSVYSMFTVIHEASHRNISRRFPRFEYLLGFLGGLLFHGSFEQFIALHLRHHAKVNVHGEDPDLHAVGPITLGRLLVWGGTICWYFWFYVRAGLYRRQSLWKTAASYVAIAAIYAFGWWKGFLPELLCFWLLPSVLGVILTAYIFDHLPHVPHKETGKYTNARVYPNSFLDWAFFMQSHHLVHHLWPSIPWYRYRDCYAQRRDELLKAGARETRLL